MFLYLEKINADECAILHLSALRYANTISGISESDIDVDDEDYNNEYLEQKED
jgi:hypothetical protein